MTTEREDDTPVREENVMEDVLVSGDVVEETPDGDDLQLTEEFEEEWHQLSEQMRGSDRAIRWFATARGVSPERVDTTSDGGEFALEIDDSVIGRWPSEAAFVAETVVRPTLREWIPESEWEQLSEELHRELSARLLLFLEQCPSCDGELVFDQEVDDDVVHVSLTCTSCGATLFSGEHE